MATQNYIPLAARICLSIIFIHSGINKIMGFSGTQQFMSANGIPMALTGLLLVATIIVQLVGGLSVLLGYKTRWGAILLILFLIPATLVFHSPFDPKQMIAFLKNLGLIGGLLMVNYAGAGAISLDARTK
ncbi:MAG: DoxX family protein [Symploca sp. SIO2E6]|nr:DoxX family protein [Symploca sp. SIO2E6]